MSEAGPTLSSLRSGRRENRWLLWALALSLLVHAAAWGGYELGHKQGWWVRPPLLTWLFRSLLPKPLAPPPPRAKPLETEPQLAFVQVAEDDPAAPEKPKFYSNRNAHAANTEPEKNTDTPKLNGKQNDAPQLDTSRHTQLAKTQPQPEAPPTPAQPQPQPAQPQPVQPQPMIKRGDMAQGNPQEAQPQPKPETPQTAPPRPRTLNQAHAQDPTHVAGVEMHQEGGVPRVALLPSFDAKATLFGDYDAQFTQAVQQKWYDLIDAQNFSGDCVGKVTLHFNLNYDGTITEIKMEDHTVAMMWAYLCQRALTEPAPFAKWPEEMRREIGGNTREMTFTFYYY